MSEGFGSDSRRRGPQSKAWRSLFRQQFFKTKLCRFYPRGECRYGSDCPYAHNATELHTTPDLSKTALCEDWQNGHCPRGAGNCPFAHGQEELRVTELFEESPLCKRVPGKDTPAQGNQQQQQPQMQVPQQQQQQPQSQSKHNKFQPQVPVPPMGPPPTGGPTRGAKMTVPIAAMHADPLLVAKGYMPNGAPNPLERMDPRMPMMMQPPNGGLVEPQTSPVNLSQLLAAGQGVYQQNMNRMGFPERQPRGPPNRNNLRDMNGMNSLGMESPLQAAVAESMTLGKQPQDLNFQPPPLSQASTASQSSIGWESSSQWGQYSGSESSPPHLRNVPLGDMARPSLQISATGGSLTALDQYPPQENDDDDDSDTGLVEDEPAYVMPSPGGGSPNRSPLSSQCASPKLRARRLRDGTSESQSPVRGWDRTPSMSPSPRRRAAPAVNTPAAAAYLHGLLDVFGKNDKASPDNAGEVDSLKYARQEYHKSLEAYYDDEDGGPPGIDGLSKAVVPVGSPYDEPVMACVPNSMTPARVGGAHSLAASQQFWPAHSYPPLQVEAARAPTF